MGFDTDGLNLDGFTIELKENGVCTSYSAGIPTDGTWTLTGSTLQITASGVTMSGTLKDGVMKFENVANTGISITLRKSDSAGGAATDASDILNRFINSGSSDAPEEDSASESAAGTAPVQMQEFWDGDWYGWWMITEADGEYAEMSGYWWDCCANITMSSPSSGEMVLWDETFSRSNALAELTLAFDDSGTYGTAASVSGWFLSEPVTPATWAIDPDTAEYPNMIAFSASYSDDTGSFEYYVCMRPWGERWDDVALSDPDDVPYYYEDWYLPLIDAGSPVPDSVGP